MGLLHVIDVLFRIAACRALGCDPFRFAALQLCVADLQLKPARCDVEFDHVTVA
ncbi:MAG: hypothetical protein JWM42_3644, partial [Burkholderia sp.]|nr:hypothetical protein [Burkholderia sp.]